MYDSGDARPWLQLGVRDAWGDDAVPARAASLVNTQHYVDHPLSRLRSRTVLSAVFVLLTFGAEGVVSPYALLTSLFDLAVALFILGGFAGWGLALVRLFLPSDAPRHLCLSVGAAVGIGVCANLLFLSGLAGIVAAPVPMALAGSGWLVAAVVWKRREASPTQGAPPGSPLWLDGLWLTAVPLAVVALLAAAKAPGFLWREEGFGYDVLEYHLAVPKEYLEAGRISYLPHNVYANMPSLVEMLYLAVLPLRQPVVEAGTTAHMMHLLLGAGAVWAAWSGARLFGRAAGVVCGVCTATTGWLTYLSGLAYVENGLLFFTGAALALLAYASRLGGSARNHALLGVGVLAGFACGCKYTAVPMVAAPLVFAALLIPSKADGYIRTLSFRLYAGFVVLIGALVAFSPWVIKNLVLTGNPVFPVANAVFDAHPEGWGPEEDARWTRGHGPTEAERSLGSRLSALWHRVPGDHLQRFTPVLFALALLGLVGRRRDRADAMLVVVLALQVGVWLFATHLFARFAVVFLPATVLLAGRALSEGASRLRTALVVGAVLLHAAWGAVGPRAFYGGGPMGGMVGLYRAESFGDAPAEAFYDGLVPGYEYLAAVNHELPPDASVLLVGEARSFYFRRPVAYATVFNRSPFITAIRRATGPKDLIAWLRQQGYTHVLVNWVEVERLAGTYGFAEEVTPELFDALEAEGLKPLRQFSRPNAAQPDAELFALSDR